MVATTMKYLLLFYICASLFMAVNAWSAEKIRDLVNAERSKAGLQPVELDARLNKAIKVQVDYCVSTNSLTHDNPQAGPLGDRITAQGYRWSTCGENLASGFSTEEAVMNAWMTSAGHRANIMNGKFKHMGVYSSQTTWGQDFGALLDNGPAVPPSGSNPPATTSNSATTSRSSTTTSRPATTSNSATTSRSSTTTSRPATTSTTSRSSTTSSRPSTTANAATTTTSSRSSTTANAATTTTTKPTTVTSRFTTVTVRQSTRRHTHTYNRNRNSTKKVIRVKTKTRASGCPTSA
ncbi:6550_t:CDS:2 [Diversispora eburnea]|uniref:6550_t:CDS:1 n=1 Tax=Diversispora eburnea TaxID=1213867 RepID=A0A9N8YQF0_9GLOM|nr:6550_t:CDS:2 [Diversispora eburnea]